MNEGITLYEYLACSDAGTRQAIADLMRSKGYIINPKNFDEFAQNIAGYAQREGIDDLMLYHPDREAILRTAGSSMHADGIVPAVTVAPVATLPATKTNEQSFTLHTPAILGIISIVSVLAIAGMVIAKN